MPVLFFIIMMLYLFLLTSNKIFIVPVVILVLIAIIWGESDYDCSIDDCNKKFKTLKELIQHIKNDHINRKKGKDE